MTALSGDSGMCGNDEQPTQKLHAVGEKFLPDPDMMVLDEPGEKAVQQQCTEKPRGGKGNKYLPPDLGDTDSEMYDVGQCLVSIFIPKFSCRVKAGNGVDDSDVAPSSREGSESGDGSTDGNVSEPDKQLEAIAHNPTALHAKFAEEVSSFWSS